MYKMRISTILIAWFLILVNCLVIYSVTARTAATQTCLKVYSTISVASCFVGATADYVMGRETGILSVCSGVFTDSGDLTSDYSENEDHSLTFCSDKQNHISFSFENFNTE